MFSLVGLKFGGDRWFGGVVEAVRRLALGATR